MTVETLDVLLIEDNPGDARLVEEMLRDTREPLHRIVLDGASPERVALQHERELSAGIEYLSANPVDVVLLDLGLPESTGLDTLVTMVDAIEFTPLIVLTGLDDRDRGIQAIQHGADDYLVKDDVSGELLIHSIQYAIEQTNQERERVRYREELEALNELNTITQQITHDVITTSSREDLERAVCERLVESDAYCLAWIGEADQQLGRLTPRATAGATEILDDLAVALDEGRAAERPEASAVSSRDVQFVQDVQKDPAFTPQDAHADEGGYRSVAAIPLSYRSVFYGILTIYAGSPDAFSHHETEILSRLGDVIGHAITAIERKNALVSNTALELEFKLTGQAEELVALSRDSACTIEFENMIRSDSGLLVYGRAESLQRAAFQELADRSPAIDDLRLLSSGEDSYEFEFMTTAVNSLDTDVASHGGHLSRARIADGEFRFVVEFPRGRDKRQLVDVVEDNCPEATLHAHRTVERDDPSIPDSRSVFQNRLTEKQRAALETAYHAGYFEWPRTSSGDEIADRLGITQATFSQHFRAAEREFFSSLFDTDEDDPAPNSPWDSSGQNAQDD